MSSSQMGLSLIYNRGLPSQSRGSFLGDANKCLHKTHLVSNGGQSLGGIGVAYAGAVGSAACSLGYRSKRKSMKGGKRRSRR